MSTYDTTDALRDTAELCVSDRLTSEEVRAIQFLRDLHKASHHSTRVLITEAEPDRVAAYLPRNFIVLGEYEGTTFIVGRDVAGWTVEDYVQPRLLSGLIATEELT